MGQNEKRKSKGKQDKIIVVMASRRRAMKDLAKVPFPPTPRPVVAHPGSLLGSPEERKAPLEKKRECYDHRKDEK